jgi:hydrogenase maturation protein HypF
MSATAAEETRRQRTRVRIEGTVQGVGFRPHVYRIARELGLAGYVCNDSSGVVIEVEGRPAEIDRLIQRITAAAPPLAVIERIARHDLPVRGASAGFEIVSSPAGGPPRASITPDSATCAACLRELFDPADRRFRYPFINCTDCGPRFTIVTGVPYDRPNTTMASFAMCGECRREYDDPSDRRFHAQPNACPRCGPSVALLTHVGTPVPGDALHTAARALRDGQIVAVKGIGGYHLACRADDERAVATLRARKHREDKPFALMAADLNAAATLVELDDAATRLLLAPERPIVLAPRHRDAPIAAAVAPGAPELGVMLPYSPLHHLLLADSGTTLVMTSGNVSDEPIAYHDEDALARLATITDLFLVHDRPIETRTDDSVVRVARVAGAPKTSFLRRSRGYVPSSLRLPDPGTPRPLLACGAELKSTFCLAKHTRAWVSHHIGDLENYETLKSFTDGIDHFRRLFDVQPEVVAHDLHPEYLSTKYALEHEDLTLIGVQHHHAHLAACLAEYGETGPAIGAIFDGTGYGTDGTVWGGEILHGDLRGFERIGFLQPVPLPGGAQAIKQPWRMAGAWLQASLESDPPLPPALEQTVTDEAWRHVLALARRGLASPQTTSAGRLFDAVAALAGVRATINYEGQAAIELEARCDPHERGYYPFAISDGVIDPRPAIRAIARAKDPIPTLAARFHNGLARVTVSACAHAAEATAADAVVLSGGVFANRRLLEQTSAGLRDAGLRVLVPRRLPVNDGGISYGQAAVASARMERQRS